MATSHIKPGTTVAYRDYGNVIKKGVVTRYVNGAGGEFYILRVEDPQRIGTTRWVNAHDVVRTVG